MIAEKLHLIQYSPFELADFFLREVFPLTPVSRSPAVAGWSILSADGSYQDGWQKTFLSYNGPGNLGPTWKPENDEQALWKTMQDYSIRTPLCNGPIAQILDQVEALGFHPRRARIIRLAANSTGQWHQDGSKSHYQARLHIPIITNNYCFFETENGSEHLAADGSFYLMHINRLHRVVNAGQEHRYHLVMNIWDTRHLTQHHRYDPLNGLP